MAVFNAKVKLYIFNSCIFFSVLNTLYVVNARPQIQNENWILPPSRQESTSSNEFQASHIFNLIDNLWSFGERKKLIPELNDNELIKRLGLPSTDDDSANNLEIPASRVENHIPEKVDANDIVSNKKDDISQPDFTENIFESWSKSIPAKIKKSMITITSEFINGTQQVKDRLEKARNSLVDNFKQAFSVPEAEIKEPKKGVRF